MTISFKIEPVTRTDNLLLITINEEKRRVLRIHNNEIKIFGLKICLDNFGFIPFYKDSRQLELDLKEEV